MGKEVEPKTGTVATRRALTPAPHLVNPAPLPPELDGLFYVREWAKSLLTGAAYHEPNPDFMSQRMMMLTASATTLEELFADNTIDGLQKLLPDEPWASTGPIMFTDLYVAKSDMEDGAKTYMLFTFVSKETGLETTTSTGATQLQLQVCSMLGMGIWPIQGQIKRSDRKDRGGRYIIKFYPED
jgi:hypothetical protein